MVKNVERNGIDDLSVHVLVDIICSCSKVCIRGYGGIFGDAFDCRQMVLSYDLPILASTKIFFVVQTSTYPFFFK